jgi:hypothetical protein
VCQISVRNDGKPRENEKDVDWMLKRGRRLSPDSRLGRGWYWSCQSVGNSVSVALFLVS